MAGSIVDLNRSVVRLPDAMLLDSSVIVPLFLPILRRSGPVLAASQARVSSFLAAASQGTLAFIAQSSFAELAHLVLRKRFTDDSAAHPDPTTGRPLPSWSRLYKQRPELTRRYADEIGAFRLALAAVEIEILQPDDLGPIGRGRRYEHELIRLVRRYRLDSTDAAVLMEAQRAGIESVVSEDPDWRRARLRSLHLAVDAQGSGDPR